MVERKGALERILVSERTRVLVSIVSCGIIVANFVISSFPKLRYFAPLDMSSSWLAAVAFVCGFALGIILNKAPTILYGVCLMALIAVFVFSCVLVSEALLSNTPFLDVVLLFAFQQSFPRFISICALGYVAAFLSTWLKPFFDQL